jgi:hypothetical protein
LTPATVYLLNRVDERDDGEVARTHADAAAVDAGADVPAPVS